MEVENDKTLKGCPSPERYKDDTDECSMLPHFQCLALHRIPCSSQHTKSSLFACAWLDLNLTCGFGRKKDCTLNTMLDFAGLSHHYLNQELNNKRWYFNNNAEFDGMIVLTIVCGIRRSLKCFDIRQWYPVPKLKAPLFKTQNRTFTSAGTIPVHVDYRHFSLVEDEQRWVLYLLKLSKIERIMDNH